MLGYQLEYPDNESYAFREQEKKRGATPKMAQMLAPEFATEGFSYVRRCSKCGQLLSKWQEPLKGLVLSKRKYDLSSTFDGVTVASYRFKTVYDENKMTGLLFDVLPDDRDFLSVIPDRSVEFDAEKRKTRFGTKCSRCGQFSSVIGADPICLKPGQAIPNLGFARTDLEFGSEDEKHPLILCGPKAGAILKKAKLRGLELVEV